MRYCKFCGRQLGDGELCSCPEAMDEYKRLHPAAPAQPAPPPAAEKGAATAPPRAAVSPDAPPKPPISQPRPPAQAGAQGDFPKTTAPGWQAGAGFTPPPPQAPKAGAGFTSPPPQAPKPGAGFTPPPPQAPKTGAGFTPPPPQAPKAGAGFTSPGPGGNYAPPPPQPGNGGGGYNPPPPPPYVGGGDCYPPPRGGFDPQPGGPGPQGGPYAPPQWPGNPPDVHPPYGYPPKPNFFNTLLRHLAELFKRPSDAMPTLAQEAHFGEAAIFMGLQALFAGLLAAALTGQLNRLFRFLGAPDEALFSGFQSLLVALLLSFALSALTALIWHGLARAFGAKLGLVQSFELVGARSVFVAALDLVCCLLAFINAGAGLFAFFVLGALLTAVCLGAASYRAPGLSPNRAVYLGMIMALVRMLLMLLFILLFSQFFLPGYMREALHEFDLEDFLGGLLYMF